MANQSRRRAFTAPRALLLVDDTPIAWAQNVSGQVDEELSVIREIGRRFAAEIEPTGTLVSGSMGRVGVLDESLASLGIVVSSSATIEEYVNSAPLTIALFDQVGDKPVKTITGARASSSGWELGVGGALTEDVDFIGIRMIDGVAD